jgi:hypothetical protein
LDVQTSDGAIEGKLALLRRPGVTVANVLELLEAVQLNAHLLFSESAAAEFLVAQSVGAATNVEDARAQIQGWIDRGHLRRRADKRYEIKVRYTNNELLVNDMRFEPTQ